MANDLSRYDPFGELGHFTALRGLEDMFRDFRSRHPLTAEAPPMRIDVSESDGAFTVNAELPGVRKDDIKVDIDGRRVSISAEIRRNTEDKKDGNVVRSERYFGQQYRSFTLDSAVDEAHSVAKFENGILHLSLPKKAEAGRHKLQIS